MGKQLRTTDDYTIFRDLTDEDRVYAVHKDEVENMKRVKDRYANETVPDEVTVKAYPVAHLRVRNNVVMDYDLVSDRPEEVQVNVLDNYIVEV
ncbi:MAG TPA: hypothetical protein VJ937_06125 [Salinivirga sp.]|uniref:hypothetical protein n=1 Tax=Salinivirga sp. TaxID=1970192 RepID=UPI002B46B370|nr:hypothetical protein [Salinivirga sp.]HKK59034.1 hypothetical protein [Salinivirga sp.]